ncbi:hypothetical protein [Candidatus Ruthturnera calyptogenae]|nr:hypothetical protein [Candidatus Ruthturnera calyptogenae]
MEDKIKKLGDILIEIFHIVGLSVVGAIIIRSAIHEYFIIMQHESGFALL